MCIPHVVYTNNDPLFFSFFFFELMNKLQGLFDKLLTIHESLNSLELKPHSDHTQTLKSDNPILQIPFAPSISIFH